MNFKSIDYFLSVARERSFTKAAAQHHITQQTISADIAALERELGQPLFLRKVPLKLTYAGEVFLRYAQGFQNSHTAMLQEFRDIAKEETGILRIGVTYARGHALMPQLIAAVENGADAVYLGGPSFNARMQAGNFDEQTFAEAIRCWEIAPVADFANRAKNGECHCIGGLIDFVFMQTACGDKQ